MELGEEDEEEEEESGGGGSEGGPEEPGTMEEDRCEIAPAASLHGPWGGQGRAGPALPGLLGVGSSKLTARHPLCRVPVICM